MLTAAGFCPGTVGEVMALIGSGADICGAGGTIAADFMLGGAVLGIFLCGGMVAVLIGTFTADRAGICPVVAGAVVIRLCAVGVCAVADTGVQIRITGCAVFVPCASFPGIGRAGVSTDYILTAACTSASGAGTVIVAALGTYTV